MSGHRHSTDRVDGVAIAECPDGCQVVEVEYGDAVDNDVLSDLKELAENCSRCGADMDILQYEEPSEVLE